MLAVQGKEGERAGAKRNQRHAAAAGAGAGKKKGRRGIEADRWGPPVGAAVKRKGKGESSGPAGSRAGPPGPKGKGAGFVFFFFFFQTSFSNLFQPKFKSNFCKPFSNIL
jgi:hypothetical protein